MQLNELTRKAAIDIIALQLKDGKPNKDLEVDIDNYLRKVIEKRVDDKVKDNSHYLLSKFVHVIATVTKDNFQQFDAIMKAIGYNISRT